MTTINAIRFDEWSGACVCDEMTSMDDDMSVLVSDKITPCVPEEVTRGCGMVAAYGSTGTCSVGDQIKATIRRRLLEENRKEVKAGGGKVEGFMSLEETARMTFRIIIDLKQRRLSEMVKSRYGFDLDEFIAASHRRGDDRIPIKEKELTTQVVDLMTWKDKPDEVDFLFLNAGLLAGYDEQNGFGIYHLDLRDGFWHPVQSLYLAEGSGRDSVDPTLSEYLGAHPVELRRGSLDPADALLHLISAVNQAAERNIGVGGYYNIILIDGRRPRDRRLREINDDRSFLALQVSRAWAKGFLDYRPAREIIEAVLLQDEPHLRMREVFLDKVRHPRELSRLLRGYKVNMLQS